MAFHVVIEIGLGAVQLPAHLAGMLPQQEYPVLRRHVPDPVLGHGAAEVADEIWLCLYRRIDAPIHSLSRFQLLRVITLEVLHHIRCRSVE